jgi:DNA-binding FadR family transcriptional regulator
MNPEVEQWLQATRHNVEDGGETDAAKIRGPVQVPSAVDTVADRLTTAIALGDFTAGERLPVERDLAALLGVGRTTVRQALTRLRSHGLIETRRGRNGGAYVRTHWTGSSAEAVRRALQPDAGNRDALGDLRCLVEATIAHTAATRRSTAHIPAIEEALNRFEHAENPAQARNADADLHRAVNVATGNPYLFELSRQLLAALVIGLPIEPYSHAGYHRALPQHRELAKAVIDGRPYDAHRIAFEHFQLTGDEIDSTWRRGSP